LAATDRGLPSDARGQHGSRTYWRRRLVATSDDRAPIRRDYHDRVRRGADRQRGSVPIWKSRSGRCWVSTKSLANELGGRGALGQTRCCQGSWRASASREAWNCMQSMRGITKEQALDRIMSRTKLQRFIQPQRDKPQPSAISAADDAVGITGTFPGTSPAVSNNVYTAGNAKVGNSQQRHGCYGWQLQASSGRSRQHPDHVRRAVAACLGEPPICVALA